MYKVVIVDDNEMAVDELRFQLRTFPDFRVVNTALNGAGGKTIILAEKPDLLVLDIELPDTDAFRLIEEISSEISWDMEIVFYTAYDKYMLQAIRKSVFDYLLKPVNKQELEQMLQRFCHKAVSAGKVNFSEKAYTLPRENSILVSTVSGKRVLEVNDIGLFRYSAGNRQWEALLTDGTILRIKHKTNASDIVACSPFYAKANQSSIININYLQAIEGNKCLFYPPFSAYGGIAVSRNEREGLEERFFCL